MKQKFLLCVDNQGYEASFKKAVLRAGKRRVGGRFPVDPARKRLRYLGVTAANRVFCPL